ncbi:MAG TPA: hypothetical protein VJA94_24875 [Candidatus Angelobacter sp.]
MRPKKSHPRNGKRLRSSTTPPAKIKIRREEGYHTHYIGTSEDGTQFMGFVVGVPIRTNIQEIGRKLRWYAVLHCFDSRGNHQGTNASFLATKEFAYQIPDAEPKLVNMIKALGTVQYGDVKVGQFSVEIDGHQFGLIDASVPEEGYQRIDLVPNDLAFFPPWDGTYET